MKKLLSALVILQLVLLFACKTPPETPVNTPVLPADAATADSTSVIPPADTHAVPDQTDANTVVVQFDTVAITKETFKKTKSEIELVVEDLNKITYTRDYPRWITYLSPEYRAEFSNQATLDTVSANLPVKGIKLNSLKDYFTYVFVPSRQNMRVDDIQFVSPVRVYVIMEIAPKSPAAIYILEKTSGGWKLVPKNQ